MQENNTNKGTGNTEKPKIKIKKKGNWFREILKKISLIQDVINSNQKDIAQDTHAIKFNTRLTVYALALFLAVFLYVFSGFNTHFTNTTNNIINTSKEAEERVEKLIKVMIANNYQAEQRLTKILERSLDNINEVSKKIDNLKLK